jgi:hypothetical protein
MLIAAIANPQSLRENIAMPMVCATAQTIVPASPKLRVLYGLPGALARRGNEASRSRAIRQVEIPLHAAALRNTPPTSMQPCTNNK